MAKGNIPFGRAGMAAARTVLSTGWMTIDGFYAVDLATGTLWNSEGAGRIDPPLLGVSVQRVLPAGGFGFGSPLASSGSQNGNEFPPDGSN